MSDEGFREIQLNGKQLIFLFMAATVFSVVVFLIGVMVGRNARLGAEPAQTAAAEIAPDAVAPATTEPVASAPSASAAADAPDPKAADQLSYADRLLRDTPPEENLKPQSAAPREPPAPVREPPAPPREAPVARETATTSAPPREVATTAPASPGAQEPVASKPPEPRPAPATPSAAAAAAKSDQTTDPSGSGFAVQVAAYKDRRESDNLAKQLIAKGYPAFVLDPVAGAPTAFFRVRVGKYKTRQEAEAAMAKLQSVEQFSKAWIAR